ncbi:hypothetical protein C0J52_05618 [Blattella germanica]|nr:hypothetical protein C0J52_05618 [Blattella germanica]
MGNELMIILRSSSLYKNLLAEVTRQIVRLDTGGSPKKMKKTAVETDRRVQRIDFLFLKAKSV